MTATKHVRFPLGRIVATPGILESVSHDEISTCLARHAQGEWGDACKEDREENDFAVDKYLRIFSVYNASDGTRFWIITEADRSATTVLLPEEY
jgi:hypothetical protein